MRLQQEEVYDRKKRQDVMERPPRRRPEQPPVNGSAHLWKMVSLIPIVILVGVTLWGVTRGIATLDQVRDERVASAKEVQEVSAQTQRSFETIWKNIQATEAQLKELTRENDRRGPRIERLEQLESKMAVLDTIQQALATLRVELRVVQESQQRLEHLFERQGRRAEPSAGAEQAPRGLPRGFP